MFRPQFQWHLPSRVVGLGQRTLVMGVVNVTPDSFSDGGNFLSHHDATCHALRLLDQGADIIDIGGESTRPGKRRQVTAKEESNRVLPVLKSVLSARPGVIISVDTYKAEVARAAIDLGVEIVNDVSAFRWDPMMAGTVARSGAGVVLMHMRGRPEDWRTQEPQENLPDLVRTQLAEWTEEAVAQGVKREQVVIDPGFGFGKNFDENYSLLNKFEDLHSLGFPLLAGTSRKSFIGRTLAREGRDAPLEARLNGTLATITACILKGAHIVRVHDVAAVVEAAKIADAILKG